MIYISMQHLQRILLMISLVFSLTPQSLIGDEAESNAPTPQQDRTKWSELIEDQDFKELDRISIDLISSHEKYQDGSSRLWEMYNLLSYNPRRDVTNNEYEQRYEFISAWIEESPNSLTPRVAKSALLIRWAFFARGSGYASSITQQGAKLFHERCQSSWDTLDEAKKNCDRLDCAYYRYRMQSALYLGHPIEEAWLDAAYKIDPLNFHPFFGRITTLLPRWGGAPGELEEYVTEMADKTSELCGDYYYAIAASYLYDWYRSNALSVHPLDWKRICSGIEDMKKLYPNAKEPYHHLIKLAVREGDLKTANELMHEIDFEYDRDYWYSKSSFSLWKTMLADGLWEGKHESLVVAFSNKASSIHVSPEGQFVFVANSSNTGRLINTSKAQGSPYFQIDSEPAAIGILWDRGSISTGHKTAPYIHITNLANGFTEYLESVTEFPASMLSSPSQPHLAFRSRGDSSVLIVDVDNDLLLARVDPVGKPIAKFNYSPDGKLLALAQDDGQVTVYEMENYTEIARWDELSGKPLQVVFSPDSKQIAVCTNKRELKVWSCPKHQLVASWEATVGEVRTVAFSADSRLLAIGLRPTKTYTRYENPLRVWDYQNDEEPVAIPGHKFGILSVTWNPEGKLVSTSYDWTLRIWNPEDAFPELLKD